MCCDTSDEQKHREENDVSHGRRRGAEDYCKFEIKRGLVDFVRGSSMWEGGNQEQGCVLYDEAASQINYGTKQYAFHIAIISGTFI